MDRRGRVLAGSNRNSVDKIQSVKPLRSRLFSGSLPSALSKEETDLIDIVEDDCIEDVPNWQKLKEISAWIDNGGPSLM